MTIRRLARWSLVPALVLPLVTCTVVRPPSTPAPPPHRAVKLIPPLPLRFEPGEPQSNADATARGRGFTLALRGGNATLSLASPDGQIDTVRMMLSGGNPASDAVAVDPQPGVANYLLGTDTSRWRTDVRGHSKVKYAGVYPGIDLIFYGNADGDLEYDFVVAPGADPSSIALRFDGARDVRIDGAGDLVLSTAAREVRQKKPRVYQRRDGRTEIVDARYVARAGTIAFEIGPYDRAEPLVIDPVIVFSTYLQSSRHDGNPHIASDAEGNVYLFGHTSGDDYPVKDAIQPFSAGDSIDLVLTKVSPDGALVYSTFLGGVGLDLAYGLAVSDSGEPYLLAYCSAGFPEAPGYRFQLSAFQNICIVKLDAAASTMIYQARLGGVTLTAIAVDPGGNVVAAGATSAGHPPPLVNAAQPTAGGRQDAVVLLLNAAGTEVLFSTWLGGNGDEFAPAVSFGPNGSVYVAGTVVYQESGSDFPLVGAPVHGPSGGRSDAYVAAYGQNGAKQFSTTIGGTAWDQLSDVRVDVNGFIYVTGDTNSADFPVRNAIVAAGPQATNKYGFAARYNPGMASAVYATFLGPGYASSVAVGTAGEAYVVGTLISTLPLRLPFQTEGTEFIMMKLSAAGALMHSSYFGGRPVAPPGRGTAALGPRGSVYVAGSTYATTVPLVNPIQGPSGVVSVTEPHDFMLARISTVAEITGIDGPPLRPGVGGRVTVRGRNFFGTTRVFVGGQWATDVSVQSLESLAATMPPLAAGTYDVTVINPDGEIDTLPDGLVYDPCVISGPPADSLSFEGTGGTRVVTVGASHPTCPWTVSSGAPWIAISRAPRAATATVTVARHTGGAARSTSVTIAGRRLDVVQLPVSAFDLNGDGHGDILWRHDQQGSLAAWMVNGTTLLGTVSLSPDRVADVTWEIVAAGDLDGDGDVDLVWRSARSGVVIGWLMNGATLAADGVIGRVDDQSWRLRASGDFNADGRAELVWQHQGDGRIALWFMDGLRNLAGEVLPQVVADTNWHIVGTGDFDGDGRRDLLWRHRTGGQMGVWLMDGRRLIDGLSLPYVVDASWKLRGVADVDGNGSADWLWQQDDDGRPAVWLMNRLTRLSGQFIGPFPSVDSAWRVVGPK